MKIGEALNWAEEKLKEAGIEESQIESEIFLEEELGLERAKIYLNFHKTIPLILDSLKNKIIKRAKHIPLAYILGRTQFMGFDFLVDERVMIPRQETEILVEAVIKKYVDSPLIVDIGTGCGNIAIALAKSIPCFRIYATDISSEALELARENAKKNAVSKERISFLQGDLFKPLNDLNLFNKIDILVSNPPYIPSGEIENLPSEVLFEPRIAIDGEFDGLGFYRKIINESPLYLKNGGYLFLEIGFNQADEVKRLISKNSNFTKPDVVLDYMGIDRIIFTQKRDK